MKEIVINELEEAAERYRPPPEWTEDEIRTMRTYYGRVPMTKLRKFVRHSDMKIHQKADELGLKRVQVTTG